VTESDFHHEVLFYADEGEFLAGTVPVLRGALERGESSLVAVRRSRTELLRGELGEDADEVEFVDMEVVGRNPARIIPVWRDFLERRAAGGGPVRGIGEPVWPGRDASELEECRRHEALLNLAFGRDREWSLLCPYDSSALDDYVLEAAYESHPHAFCHGARIESAAWRGWENSHSPFAGHLPPPPVSSQTLRFGRDGLAAVRALIAKEAGKASLSGERGRDVVVAVSELSANSVLHGGGHGTVRTWCEPGAFLVEVRDRGTIENPLVGRLRPDITQDGGRGLWMVNQLCDLVQIRSDADGAGVRVRMNVS
jgi:anti-sigma regulatory factor (Ser/Thr protein kinase)